MASTILVAHSVVLLPISHLLITSLSALITARGFHCQPRARTTLKQQAQILDFTFPFGRALGLDKPQNTFGRWRDPMMRQVSTIATRVLSESIQIQRIKYGRRFRLILLYQCAMQVPRLKTALSETARALYLRGRAARPYATRGSSSPGRARATRARR